MNYHLTTAGSARSVGTTDKEPGYYPATETLAEHFVAPGEWVETRIAELDELSADHVVARVIMMWWREVGSRQ